MDIEEKAKPGGLILSLITSLGLGGGGGAAISYYVQETQARAIDKIEIRQDKLEARQYKLEGSIFSELKEMNTRLSRIEGHLQK